MKGLQGMWRLELTELPSCEGGARAEILHSSPPWPKEMTELSNSRSSEWRVLCLAWFSCWIRAHRGIEVRMRSSPNSSKTPMHKWLLL
jgi:hypothetical protein